MKLPRINPTRAARAMPMPQGKASSKITSEAARGRQHEPARARPDPQRGKRRGHRRVPVDLDSELCAICADSIGHARESGRVIGFAYVWITDVSVTLKKK